MSATTALGWFASLLAISMFLPQLVRTFRLGFEGSIGTIVIALGNGIAWTVYGALRHDSVIVICNALLSASTMAILGRWAADRGSATDAPVLAEPLEFEEAA